MSPRPDRRSDPRPDRGPRRGGPPSGNRPGSRPSNFAGSRTSSRSGSRPGSRPIRTIDTRGRSSWESREGSERGSDGRDRDSRSPRPGEPRPFEPRSIERRSFERGSPERGSPERRQGERPYGERPSGYRPSGPRSGSQRPAGPRPSGQRPGGERTFGERSFTDRARPERTYGERRPAERGYGERGSGEGRPPFRPRTTPFVRGGHGPALPAAAPAARGEGNDRGEASSFAAAAPSDLIWGRHSTQATLESGRPIHRVWCTPEMRFNPRFLQLLREAKASGVLVEEVTWARLGQLTGGAVHQGIVLQPAAAETLDLPSLIEGCRSIGEAPLLIALDGLTDPQNLGAIVRSAEALGAHGMVLPQRRSAGLTGSVAKVAAGALEHLPVARVVNLNRALDSLKQEGYRVVGLAAEGALSLEQADLDGPLVLVTGSEAEGLSMLTRRSCDQVVRIPLRGATPSLNASVATALLLYEVARRGWMKGLEGSSPAPRLVRPSLPSPPPAPSLAAPSPEEQATEAGPAASETEASETVSSGPAAEAPPADDPSFELADKDPFSDLEPDDAVPAFDEPAIDQPGIDELATAAELFPDFEPEAGGEPFSDADAEADSVADTDTEASAEANAGLQPPSVHEPIAFTTGPVTALTFEADIRL